MPDEESPLGTKDKRTHRVLYSSFQVGEKLPGYVRYALAQLAKTGFDVVLITNQTSLDHEAQTFLREHRIALFVTENRGFDFGMWRRYLESIPESERNAFERLVLVNDSVIYFRDVFRDLFERAEAKNADMVSLSSNNDYGFHLQSFFLYMKPRAISVFFEHLLSENEQSEYWGAVMNMEVGLSQSMIRQNLVLEPLYQFDIPFDFSYETLIRMHAGFVKRKLLEKRYTFGQTMFFLRNNRRALDLGYRSLILQQGGKDADFQPEWLITRPPPSFREKARIRFWRILFWGWTLISDGCLLAVSAYVGLSLFKWGGVVGGVLVGAVAAVFLFRLRHIGRDWITKRSVRPISISK